MLFLLINPIDFLQQDNENFGIIKVIICFSQYELSF